MPDQNILKTTADRFLKARERAWQEHPPPCSPKDRVLPCFEAGRCPAGIETENCQHRQVIQKSIEQYVKESAAV